MQFRTLTPAETAKFRQWARDNYVPNSPIDGVWHPAVQAECVQINQHVGLVMPTPASEEIGYA